jgi:hypothetical protein
MSSRLPSHPLWERPIANAYEVDSLGSRRGKQMKLVAFVTGQLTVRPILA